MWSGVKNYTARCIKLVRIAGEKCNNVEILKKHGVNDVLTG